MKPSHSPSFCQLTWFCALLLLFLFSFFCTTMASASEISYSDHCASIVPESSPTGRFSTQSPILHLATSYFKGGEQILGKKSTDQLFNSSDVYLSLYITENIYVTKTSGVYKVQARLRFRLPHQYLNYSGYGQWYHPRDVYRRRSLRFLLNGFFSEQSRKLCMVGKASWQSAEGKLRNLEAVFQFNHAKKNSTLLTSLAKGTLKSLSSSNSPNYFEPIEIVSLPVLSDYNYTLASKGLGGGCLGGNDIPPNRSLSLLPGSICSRFLWRTYDFEVEYAAGCKSTSDCGPFKKKHAHLSLSAFQCSEDEEKLRYILAFHNEYYWHYQSFDPKTTLIGEGSWNSEKNQLCIVACRMLNSDKSLEDVRVGDCSVRLSIQFPLVWNITDTSSIVGLVWTNKTATDPGHFKVTSSNNNGESLPGLKYEYTQVGKARELCPRKEVVKENGDNFPKGNSYDMRFDMSVKHSKEEIAWGNGLPIFVNSEHYGENFVITEDSGLGEVEESTNIYSSQMNISYKITFSYINLKEQIASLNSSLNQWGQLVISAEGVYDTETGHLCMVGCREIHPLHSSEKSFDCEMIIDVEFPPLSSMVGSSINGVIQSRRAKTDSLYFEQLNISSSSYYTVQAQESIWRMDLEIIMVLISNTLACLFVASQLFYVKKHPEVLPFISVVMLSIITLGHMVPLVLNLEALFIKNHDQQNVILRGDGWLELNEVSVRLVSLVVFLLLLRLLQLAWTARTEDGDGNHLCAAEKKTAFVSLLLYAVGGLIAFLVELEKNGNGNGMPRSLYPAYNTTIPDPSLVMSEQSYTLRYLKSYAGLVLDGFLLPQILFNIFQNSREKALSYLFYIGTTLVRLVPHAYDLYRVHNYMRQDFYGSYIYANHSADFYSIAWDVIIPCGCIAFAVIIWLQQRFGGSCVLPQKIRELGLYEKVPVVSGE
ncbi:uncharacterized protein LOC113769940 [Coffea eugenioides]|uniref:uncharacterized protein LOC113769940 n=1 Tax=Coffea eugenioides TaxID=49369 RepID=UPI000F60E72E|nr:uncharacterized protein LOC113769940 [Coffea eugenioides]